MFYAGVILFVLMVGRQPFEKACCLDERYRALKCENEEMFWEYHERKNNKSLIDSDLKELLTCMLQSKKVNKIYWR